MVTAVAHGLDVELGEELPEPPPKRLPKSPPAGPNKLSKELEEAEDDEDEEDELPKEPKMLDKRPEPDGVAAVSVPVGVTPVVEVGETVQKTREKSTTGRTGSS